MSEKVNIGGKSSRNNGNGHKKILGPVHNLEQFVREDWWKHTFNSNYLKTDGDVINDPNITKAEIDLFLSILNPGLEDRILDLCCGQGRHFIELTRRGFVNVEGLDRSHYLIRKAKQQSKIESLNIKFREGDARRLPYQPDEFNFVLILGNSFGYFETIDDDLRVLREVFKTLIPSGKLLIDVANGKYLRENFQPHSWEWMDKKHFVCRERKISRDERLISREVVIHVDKGVIVDQFYAERLYTQESLSKLLEKAGFGSIISHGNFSPNSERNQDLGMMANRLIITAETHKLWTPKKTRKIQDIKNVVVVMGDPNKQDIIKPNHTFDEDDFYTIDQLKIALSKLKDYRFTYLTNHNTLRHDLERLKENINYVFNLCDEGFNNDARQELHIPSLLDILGIPYTGAGPQCLVYCYDKSLVRGIAREMGIPVPEAYLIKSDDMSIEIPDKNFPVIVKPNFGDSSFGITQRCVAYNPEQLLNAISEIREKFGYNNPMLVEEFLQGKDLTLGIIGNIFEYRILSIIEEDYSELPEDLPRICGYEAKWDSQSPYWNLKAKPAELLEGTKDDIINHSLRLFERLACKDYARFDWRLDSYGNPKLLEVNPNPGWCWDGHLAKAAKFTGISYHQMLELILKAAEQKFSYEKNGNGKKEYSPIPLIVAHA